MRVVLDATAVAWQLLRRHRRDGVRWGRLQAHHYAIAATAYTWTEKEMHRTSLSPAGKLGAEEGPTSRARAPARRRR